jgi:hypothetical protein
MKFVDNKIRKFVCPKLYVQKFLNFDSKKMVKFCATFVLYIFSKIVMIMIKLVKTATMHKFHDRKTIAN